jgi:hypothetical protein
MKENGYHINANIRLLKDITSVKFHVANNDYFGTAATMISLLRGQLAEAIKKAPENDRKLIDTAFKNLESDLLLLQGDYQIRAKKKKTQAAPKGKLKSQ